MHRVFPVPNRSPHASDDAAPNLLATACKVQYIPIQVPGDGPSTSKDAANCGDEWPSTCECRSAGTFSCDAGPSQLARNHLARVAQVVDNKDLLPPLTTLGHQHRIPPGGILRQAQLLRRHRSNGHQPGTTNVDHHQSEQAPVASPQTLAAPVTGGHRPSRPVTTRGNGAAKKVASGGRDGQRAVGELGVSAALSRTTEQAAPCPGVASNRRTPHMSDTSDPTINAPDETSARMGALDTANSTPRLQRPTCGSGPPRRE
jgi:hypothetical protein